MDAFPGHVDLRGTMVRRASVALGAFVGGLEVTRRGMAGSDCCSTCGLVHVFSFLADLF
jgi:hypothetical protein